MSKNSKPEDKSDNLTRRGILEKAALMVGAATSVATAESALARTADVAIDSAGRVLIGGAPLSPGAKSEGTFEEARGGGGGGGSKPSGVNGARKADNMGCTNTGGCAKPASTKAVAPKKKGLNTGCTNTGGCRSLRR